MPFCPQLKQKLRQKQLLTNLHQAQMLRRRVAIMTDQANSINAASNAASSTPTQDSSPVLSSSSPFSSGSLGKVSGPPRAALIAAHDAQLQAEKQRQATAPVISSIGKGKPAMQPPVRPSPASLGPSAGKPIVGAQKPWSPYYPQIQQQQQQQQPRTALVTSMMPGMQQTHPQQQQPSQQPLQQQQQALPAMDVNAVSTSGMSVSSVASGASALGPLQMLQAIKHQSLTQADWMAVIKKNPQLMAQVLKLKNINNQKIMQQQQQQQQSQQQMQGMPNMVNSMQQVEEQTQQQQMQKQMSQMIPQQYRQQQMQAQQQTSQMNQFAQPQQPFVQARMNFQQTFQNDAGHNMHQYQQQQQQQHMLQHHQAQLKQQMAGGQPMSPQFMMAQQTSPSPQQMLQQVRSPPISAAMLPQTVRSPQPIPSPRQPIPSPHHNMVNNQSPLHGLSLGQDTSQYTNDHVMMSTLQAHNSYSQMSSLDMNMGQQDEVAPLTPQDQLAHYVNQM